MTKKGLASRFLWIVFLGVNLWGFARGQSLGNHYPLGVEGIKAGFPPPMGLYLRNYTTYYSSDQLNDAQSQRLSLNFHQTIVADATRFSYVTHYQIFGGNYGFGMIVPYVYNSTTIASNTQTHLGVADIYFEPVIVGWHLEQFDIMTNAGFFAPTAHFNPTDASSLGNGFWTGMYTLGVTYYPDKEKLWNLSLLNRLEFSTEQEQTHIQPGFGESFEWGVGRSFLIGPHENGPPDGILDVGVAGYCGCQYTRTTGPYPMHSQDVAAAGPEIAYTMPKSNTLFSIRYEPEFESKARPEGATLNLTITTKVW